MVPPGDDSGAGRLVGRWCPPGGSGTNFMCVSGSSTWCHGEMLWQGYSHVWTIRWWPVVRGASRHSCSEDRSLFSPKGYRDDRRLKASVGYEGGKRKGEVC
ncbi:hypothetical protein DEO72_LG3g821 [Vigna unguiculata]|uniref:Uncharacterized protein n=1 Tax=Vigna unguiculata TaxID=3917 RepID=A0A4D6LCT7_VIGUN|nr:hypothetical protein DEO72_LG3g821 [Vigna unguiculata]